MKTTPQTALSLLWLLMMVSLVRTWHGNGHYLVAYIAQEYLLEVNPEALKWANELLKPFVELCGEDLYPFVEAATWPDKIKDQGWHLFDDHHFISNAWFDKGAAPREYDNSTSANIVFAIGDNTKTLQSIKEDPFGSSKSILGKSISLRQLIHYLGDIHQPLHAEERVTPDRPDGDMGGNMFKIDYYTDSFMNNLHFIWDEMFEDYAESIRSNLPQEKYMFIKRKGDGIIGEYPYERLRKAIDTNNTPKSWGLESFEIARTFAYNGLEEGKKLPEDYQREGRRICRERVALGGYRLGQLLDSIYKSVQIAKKNKKSSYTKLRSSSTSSDVSTHSELSGSINAVEA